MGKSLRKPPLDEKILKRGDSHSPRSTNRPGSKHPNPEVQLRLLLQLPPTFAGGAPPQTSISQRESVAGPASSSTENRSSENHTNTFDHRLRKMLEQVTEDVARAFGPEAESMPVGLEEAFAARSGAMKNEFPTAEGMMRFAAKIASDAFEQVRFAPLKFVFRYWLSAELLLLDWTRICSEVSAKHRKLATPIRLQAAARLQYGIICAGDILLRNEQTLIQVATALVPGERSIQRELRGILERNLAEPTLALRSPQGREVDEAVLSMKEHPLELHLKNTYCAGFAVVADDNWPKADILIGALAHQRSDEVTAVHVIAMRPWAPCSLWLAKAAVTQAEYKDAVAEGRFHTILWRLVGRTPMKRRTAKKDITAVQPPSPVKTPRTPRKKTS